MRPSFALLWSQYPSISNPCTEAWKNQCAIRLSIALVQSGMDLDGYSDPKCGHGHARGAESLANWLWREHLGSPSRWYSAATGKAAIGGRVGIIFFKDCFTREGESEAVGDHIDLWNRNQTRGFQDPYNRSREVWFWAL